MSKESGNEDREADSGENVAYEGVHENDMEPSDSQQIDRRQHLELPAHPCEESATNSIPVRQNLDVPFDNNEMEDDEEAVLHSIAPPDEQELVVANEENDDIAPFFEQEEPLMDTEQDDFVEDARREEHERDTDTATGVFSAYLAPGEPGAAQQRMADNVVVATNVRIHPSEFREPPTNNKWKTPLIVLLAVVAAAVLAIVLGLTLSGRTTNEPITSMSPTPAPTSARFGQAASLVESFFNTTFDDSSTPRYQATQWIADVDTLFEDFASVDPGRFSQRYTLALLYFATGGQSSWIETSFFLNPGIHECEWRDTGLPNTQSWSGYVGVFDCSSENWVEGIEINQNNLTGTLPPELGALSSLTEFVVFGNSIGGTLPPSLFNLSKLQNLTLWFNELTGTLPTEIGRATSLITLYLDVNSFTGTIPTEIGGLSRLDGLALGLNFLTGSIPAMLLELSNVAALDLGKNMLSGTLPPSVWSSWQNLINFGLWDNFLSGAIPSGIDTLSRLDQFVLSENNFTGPFPSSVVALSNLTWLSLFGNDLTGSVPNDWSNLSSTLVRLQVATNRLTGTLPESWGSLTKLEWLNFFDNGFNGTLPVGLGNLTKLQGFQFSNNSLTGTVPLSFVQLTSLRELALFRNELTGDLSFLCNGTETLFPNLNNFRADCFGEIDCPCCNVCCTMYGTCRDV